jgi:hypothetical protein
MLSPKMQAWMEEHVWELLVEARRMDQRELMFGPRGTPDRTTTTYMPAPQHTKLSQEIHSQRQPLQTPFLSQMSFHQIYPSSSQSEPYIGPHVTIPSSTEHTSTSAEPAASVQNQGEQEPGKNSDNTAGIWTPQLTSL